MTSVGDYLKKEREARHLSVQEVAELTKISERYLACIECGAYDQLPPGPYAKGYIAAYARQVCGDETQALKLYSGYHAASQPLDTPSVDRAEAILGDEAGFSSSKVNGGSKWQATVATGLNFARSLRQSLPQKGNLKHLSNGGAKEKPTLTARLRTLLGSLGKLTAILKRFPKDFLVKSGLVVGLMLVCAVVLVLAGFGVYHLFIFQEPSQASSALQTQVAESPPTLVASVGEHSTAAAPAAKSGVDATKPKATDEVPPHKSKKVKKASISEIVASRPAVAKTAPGRAQKAPPPTPGTTVKNTPKPQMDETRPAATTAPQPSMSEASPPQSDSVAAAVDIPVELFKASVCTAIEERMPVGVSEVFPWTTPKIYVWSLLRANDPPAKVRHIYYHDGRMVSDVTLKVGSSYWRTWSFHTLSGQLHIGPWHVDIATMDGRVMRRLHFEIQ
jgi:cytoskeletal protein RodZ